MTKEQTLILNIQLKFILNYVLLTDAYCISPNKTRQMCQASEKIMFYLSLPLEIN